METSKIENYVRSHIQASPKLSILNADERLCFGVTGLNEEAGEVAGLLCREIYKKQDMPMDKWLEELGDCLWYLTAATIAKGLTLEQLFGYNEQKLQGRYRGELVPFREEEMA